MKALIISVGTGTRGGKDAAESIASAIAYSLKHHNPDKIIFVTSRQSREQTLPVVVEKSGIQTEDYDVIIVEDPDDVQSVYEKVGTYLQRIRTEYSYVVIDFTSGTKAMTAALAVLATISEVQELSYIIGKRVNGIVQHGTERILSIQPYFAIAEQKIKLAVSLFNLSQYEAAASILNQIKASTGDLVIPERINPILTLAQAYANWDKFQHLMAYELLMPLKIDEINRNKRFLGQLKTKLEKHSEPEPYLIADLINNAERRARKEQKYDDAVARLYRTIELIAHYLLKKFYGIDPANVDAAALPKNLLVDFGIPEGMKSLKLALEKSYKLLEAKGHEIGKKYVEDRKLRDLLSKRNTSILAHGLEPVKEETYIELREKVIEYAEAAVPNLEQLIEDSTFIQLNENPTQFGNTMRGV
ncbi:MAG: TIGR02710 family CRISPR-associated CARF protein [Candidatus Bathyarchaeota archaeon]|nr:TIGR02710 family CRISPR-associated CARF protein [Candidatus Bathyarchaeota archaeon]